MKYELSGLPAPYVASASFIKQTLSWPDRTVAERWTQGAANRNQELWPFALALATGRTAPARGQVYSSLALPDAAVAERLTREAPAYKGEVSWQVWKPEIVAELPLRVDAAVNDGGFGVRIETVQPHDGVQVDVELREHTPEFVTQDAPLAMPTSISNLLRLPVAYCIVNRQKAGVLFATPGGREEVYSVATVRRFQQRLVFSPRIPAEAPATDNLDAWLRDAVLVKIVYRKEGSFSRTVETPRLEIEATPVPAHN